MRSHKIKGGGGLELFVSDQGAEDAQALVFIHGWAQHHTAWQEQAQLAERFRLIALDMRGHGASDAPQEVSAYTDSQLWAGDIHAILTELKLQSPVLIGWSYGAHVISCYLHHHGESALAGLVLAGGIIAIGAHRQAWMAGTGSPALNRDLYTEDQPRLIAATAAFVDACTFAPLPRETYGRLVAANMLTTPLVRRALFKTDWDCAPIWQATEKPALLIHGAQDDIVTPAVAEAAHKAFPNAELQIWDETGHAPFAENPERFNSALTRFAQEAA